MSLERSEPTNQNFPENLNEEALRHMYDSISVYRPKQDKKDPSEGNVVLSEEWLAKKAKELNTSPQELEAQIRQSFIEKKVAGPAAEYLKELQSKKKPN